MYNLQPPTPPPREKNRRKLQLHSDGGSGNSIFGRLRGFLQPVNVNVPQPEPEAITEETPQDDIEEIDLGTEDLEDTNI